MKTHHEGYQEARQRVALMDEKELLSLLDDLYGRDEIPFPMNEEQIRREAYRQLDREWRTGYGRRNQADAEALAAAIKATQRAAQRNPLLSTIFNN